MDQTAAFAVYLIAMPGRLEGHKLPAPQHMKFTHFFMHGKRWRDFYVHEVKPEDRNLFLQTELFSVMSSVLFITYSAAFGFLLHTIPLFTYQKIDHTALLLSPPVSR